MPFLKSYKEPRSRVLEELTKKNGLRHAIFTVKGDKYVGEWKGNLKHGKGAQLWRNKHVYEGDWVNGMRHGYGVLSRILEDGVTQTLLYEGDWKYGKPEMWRNKHVYEGDWVNGMRHGYGVLSRILEDGVTQTLLYEGDWKYGKPEGFGRKHSGDEYYEGEFKAGKRHGQGRMWFADGSFYDGTWLDNMKDGVGLFVYPNGNRYEGLWRANQKHGYGEFYHLLTGQMQDGVWNKGMAVCSNMTDIMFRQACAQPTSHPIKQNELESPTLVYEVEANRIIHQQEEPEPDIVVESPPPMPSLSPWFYVDCCNKVFPKKS